MRWQTAGLCVLSLVAMTGCPETYGRGGRLDQAAHEDIQERARQLSCTVDVYKEHCLDDEDSDECLKHCGG